MLNIVVVFCGFLIAVVLARIIIPRILIISLRKRLFDTGRTEGAQKAGISAGWSFFFPRYPVYWHFSDRDLLYDKMGLLGGHSAALGTNSVYVHGVDLAVHCGYCG